MPLSLGMVTASLGSGVGVPGAARAFLPTMASPWMERRASSRGLRSIPRSAGSGLTRRRRLDLIAGALSLLGQQVVYRKDVERLVGERGRCQSIRPCLCSRSKNQHKPRFLGEESATLRGIRTTTEIRTSNPNHHGNPNPQP